MIGAVLRRLTDREQRILAKLRDGLAATEDVARDAAWLTDQGVDPKAAVRMLHRRLVSQSARIPVARLRAELAALLSVTPEDAYWMAQYGQSPVHAAETLRRLLVLRTVTMARWRNRAVKAGSGVAALMMMASLLASMSIIAGTSDTALPLTIATGQTFPNATNTGVPSGTTLTDYTGPCVITTANLVLDSKTITCPDGLGIQAHNVTITKSKINGLVRLDEDSPAFADWTLTLTDTEIDAGIIQQAALCCGDVTATRVNLHGGQTAAQCEEQSDHCVITDSYLHGQALPDDQPWHLGGFLSDGTLGTTHCDAGWCIQLIHNYIVCDHAVNSVDEGCSGDVNLIPNFAASSGVLIQNNFLGANNDSSFCTFGGEKSTSPTPHGDHISYLNNVFQKSNTQPSGTTHQCARFGPVTGFSVSGVGNVFTGNVYDDGTAVLPTL